jgi:low affinity Fe/Cu permease
VLHTILFILSFVIAYSGLVSFDRMLNIVTNIVSLEAIYLSIFIQMSINLNNENIGALQEDIEEINENIEEILEDENEAEDVKILIEELTSIYKKVDNQKTKQIIQDRIKEIKKNSKGTN